MEIIRVVPSGYCKGVINAINLVKKTRQDYPFEKIYILGMIVHNTFVSNELKKFGIISLDDTNKSKEELLDEVKEGIITFTAHGISDKIKQKAIAKGLITVDATCSDVLRTQNIVKEYLAKDYDVIYFGKKGHPEAEAVLSLSPAIHLLTSKEDVDDLNIHNEKIFVTNQTTMSYLELADVFKYLKEKYPHCLIEEEICKATSSRQKAIMDIVDGDVLYVVGDSKSNNTNKLVSLGKHNFKKVYLINSKNDINKNDLVDQNKIYVTAGASTPPVLIDETIEYLNSLASEF